VEQGDEPGADILPADGAQAVALRIQQSGATPATLYHDCITC